MSSSDDKVFRLLTPLPGITVVSIDQPGAGISSQRLKSEIDTFACLLVRTGGGERVQ